MAILDGDPQTGASNAEGMKNRDFQVSSSSLCVYDATTSQKDDIRTARA